MVSHSVSGLPPPEPNIPSSRIPLRTEAQTDASSLIGGISVQGEPTPSADLSERTAVPIDDSALLEELDQLLKHHAAQIEKELKLLEHAKNRHELVENIAEAESWVNWGPETVETTTDAVEKGVEFLEHVLPEHYIPQFPHLPPLENLGHLTSYAGAFLNALDYGSEGITLICRYKILEQSKKVLKHYQEAVQPASTHSLSLDEMKKADQTLLEWKMNIHLEEEKLHEELLEFKLSTTSKGVYLLSLPFTHIIKETALTKGIAIGLSWVMEGLDVLISGLELKNMRSEAGSFQQWIESYQKWANERQPLLQTQGDPITGKVAAMNLVVQTGNALLAKRKAAQQTKIDELAPSFDTVVDKIREMKKKQFIYEMQQLLWEEMVPYPSSTIIQEKFVQWGFYSSEVREKNQPLLEAFDQFKLAQGEKDPSTLQSEFSRWMEDPAALDEQFENWFAKEPQEKLLRFYVDHQDTIEQTTRNALLEMVKQKHTLENRFINFKLKKATIEFTIASIALAISLTLAILTLLSIPFAGAGLILLSLSVGSIPISLGLLGAGYFLSSRLKPNVTKAFSLSFQAKMMWAKLRSSIHAYSLQAKEKKLLEVAKIVRELHNSAITQKLDEPKYQKALADYKQAKIDFEACKEQVDRWNEKVENLESHLSDKEWEDFARHAGLAIDENEFDTLRAFHEAIQASYWRLLSDETKTLLTDQLGIDLETLQDQIQSNPEEIQNTFREFFVLDNDSMLSFIKKQQLHLKQI